MAEPLLRVRDLTVHLRSPSSLVLDSLCFEIGVGETIGILGESGVGKTTLAKALICLLSPRCWSVDGSIKFREIEMLRATERRLQKIRGAEISFISQEPELALNPILAVGKQVGEVLRAHSSFDRRGREEEVRSILATVGLPDPRVYRAYPHQLSGGQRQRVAIALSLVSKPSLLIADEPTSALDNVTQAAILDLLRDLRERFQLALLFITHNPALLSRLSSRVLVMCAGRIVEAGTFKQVYSNPSHPFTQELLKSIPPIPGKRPPFGSELDCQPEQPG